ncbi:MAG: putative ABC transporter permease [Coriobacteriales bacterium]|nr:putative ABC transporter permease [Coriobacteriales bacterium]
MGLVRLWLVFMVISVAVNIFALILFAEFKPQLSFDDLLVYTNVVCSGVAIWLIVERKRFARLFICCYCAIIIIVGFAGDIILQQGVLSWQLFINHGRTVFLVCFAYFLISRRAKQVLTAGFDRHTLNVKKSDDRAIFNIKSREFWRDVAMHFIVFSVVGHWMEIVYSIFARYALGIYDPNAPMWQSLFAPFTIYGVGMVACILLLYPFKLYLEKHIHRGSLVLLLSFMANTLVCTAIELTVGLAVNVPDANGHLIYWDYSNIPFNFMGQICLQNALAFGMVATLTVWVLYPALERFLLSRPRDAVNMAFVAIVVVYLLLLAAYVINPSLMGFNLIPYDSLISDVLSAEAVRI